MVYTEFLKKMKKEKRCLASHAGVCLVGRSAQQRGKHI